MQKLVRDLNHLYRARPALHARDCEPEGFDWLIADDSAELGLCLAAQGAGRQSGRRDLQFHAGAAGRLSRAAAGGGNWREIINTDATDYGGSGMGNGGAVEASAGEGGAVAAIDDCCRRCRRSCSNWRPD